MTDELFKRQNRLRKLLEPLTDYANNFAVDDEPRLGRDLRAHFLDLYRAKLDKNHSLADEDDFDVLTGNALYDLTQAMRLAEIMIGPQAAIDLLHSKTSYVTFLPYVLERLPARIVRGLLEKEIDDIINERITIGGASERIAKKGARSGRTY